MQKKKLEIRVGRQEQWNPNSTPWIFFFPLTRISYEHSERFLTIFLCRVSIWRVSNAKKNLKFEREQQEYNCNC